MGGSQSLPLCSSVRSNKKNSLRSAPVCPRHLRVLSISVTCGAAWPCSLRLFPLSVASPTYRGSLHTPGSASWGGETSLPPRTRAGCGQGGHGSPADHVHSWVQGAGQAQEGRRSSADSGQGVGGAVCPSRDLALGQAPRGQRRGTPAGPPSCLLSRWVMGGSLLWLWFQSCSTPTHRLNGGALVSASQLTSSCALPGGPGFPASWWHWALKLSCY